MKICFVSAFFPETVGSPDQMLAAWPLLRQLPPALARHGHEVVVLAYADRSATLDNENVRYRFIDPGSAATRVSRWLQNWKPRHGAAYYLPAMRIMREIRAQRPDIVHFFGLTLDLLLAQVALICSRLSIPLVVHFHGGEPDRGRMRSVQRFNATRIDRVLVTTMEQAALWVDAGLFPAKAFSQVVESSSPFAGIDRGDAQARTTMRGDPVYLSAGRLDPIKDPLTLLRGFDVIARHQLHARLYMYYLSAELMPEVLAFLSEHSHLAERVELRGRAPLEEMEAIYSSADILLQASLREWSGLAVIEAMSCGCVPVVSDIPSFRMLTAGGTYGRLFAVGNAEDLARVVLSLSIGERLSLSESTREHFQRELSFDAMARKISAIYDDVIAIRARRSALVDSQR